MSKYYAMRYDGNRDETLNLLKSNAMLLGKELNADNPRLQHQVGIGMYAYFCEGKDAYSAISSLFTSNDINNSYKYLMLRDDYRILDIHFTLILRAKPIDDSTDLLVT